MGAQLNHTIVWSSDQTKSARFLAEMLGRSAPTRFGHFDVVELDNGVSLDFANAEGPIQPQHYAFLISETDFDAVLGRIRQRGLDHWADPDAPPPRRDQSKRRRPRGLFFRPGRPLPGSNHPILRKRRLSLAQGQRRDGS